MTDASSYFTASDFFTGAPPMFGPTGFAAGFTPSHDYPPGLFDGEVGRLDWRTDIERSAWLFPDGTFDSCEDETAALALCEKQAQAWIRSRGWEIRLYRDQIGLRPDSMTDWWWIGPDKPNWLDAAKFVHEDTTEPPCPTA